MIVDTIKEFCSNKGFVQLGKSVRTNTNGYPFITFIDKDNKAENVYFSKSASQSVGAGQLVTKDLLSTLQVATTQNAEGQVRIKLISNSERLDISSLLD